MIPYNWFEEAQARIIPHLHQTPLTQDKSNNWWIKWENHQITRSFKARGALNKVLSLNDWEQKKGLVTASAGNHGQGVALAGNIIKTKVTVFVPANAVPAKIRAIKELGAEVQLVNGGYEQSERAGKDYAKLTGLTWISPYNDGQVIAGQGTLAMEILEAWPDAKEVTWIVPVGGGGLISGISTYLKTNPVTSETVKIIGVQSTASAFMYNIFKFGTQAGVEDLPSLADGLSGAVEHSSVTIPIVRKYVDDFILVTEDEISQAIAFAWHNYHEKIEGSAATTLAALISRKITDHPTVILISGGNIASELHTRIVTQQ